MELIFFVLFVIAIVTISIYRRKARGSHRNTMEKRPLRQRGPGRDHDAGHGNDGDAGGEGGDGGD